MRNKQQVHIQILDLLYYNQCSHVRVSTICFGQLQEGVLRSNVLTFYVIYLQRTPPWRWPK